jgi:hypothetical protein
MIESDGKWETKDLYLAAYLRMIGFSLAGMRPEGDRIVYFRFGDSPKRREAEQAYWQRTEKVIPRDWLDQIRAVRSFADELIKEISDERNRDKALRQPA